jgi:mannonate dehydratase
MLAVSRRELIRGAAPAAAAWLAGAPREARAASKPARMVVGCQRAPSDERALSFFKRHAVDHICGYPPREDERASWTQDALARLRDECRRHGVALDMVQFPFLASNPIDASARKAIMLGREPERQQEIDEVSEIIRNCAAVGIPAVKYNLNLLGVLRTAPSEGRGARAAAPGGSTRPCQSPS